MTWYIDAGPENDVIISSRIRLARNLKDTPFPHRMEAARSEKVARHIMDRFFDSNAALKQEYLTVNLDDLSSEDQLSLVEKRLISEDLVKKKGSRYALVRRDEALSIMINEEDHLRIQSMQAGMDLQSAFDAAMKAADICEKTMDIAYSDRYGFLTACPTNTGTGMRSSVMAHLPGLSLSGVMRSIADSLSKMGFAVRGYYGEHSKSLGNLFQISNQLTLGISEEDLIRDLTALLQQLTRQERNNRETLYEQEPLRMEDRVLRAYGILQKARLITSEEAMTLLSDLRLGMALGIVKDLKQENINRIQTMIGPASIQKTCGRIMHSQERDEARAKLIRQSLQDETTENA